jgi:hypothetical protein
MKSPQQLHTDLHHQSNHLARTTHYKLIDKDEWKKLQHDLQSTENEKKPTLHGRGTGGQGELRVPGYGGLSKGEMLVPRSVVEDELHAPVPGQPPRVSQTAE